MRPGKLRRVGQEEGGARGGDATRGQAHSNARYAAALDQSSAALRLGAGAASRGGDILAGIHALQRCVRGADAEIERTRQGSLRKTSRLNRAPMLPFPFFFWQLWSRQPRTHSAEPIIGSQPQRAFWEPCSLCRLSRAQVRRTSARRRARRSAAPRRRPPRPRSDKTRCACLPACHPRPPPQRAVTSSISRPLWRCRVWSL